MNKRTKNDNRIGRSPNLAPTSSESKQLNQSEFPQSICSSLPQSRARSGDPLSNKSYLGQANFTKWATFRLPKIYFLILKLLTFSDL